MRKVLSLFLSVFISCLCVAPSVFPFEDLKYIGEIAIEKNIKPADITLDASGNFYILDKGSGKIVIYSKNGNITDRKTVGTAKLFSSGGEIDIDKNGNFIVVDSATNKIYKLSPEFKELFIIGGSGRSESQFKNPTGLAIDDSSNFYVADSGNRRIQVFNTDGIFFGQVKSGEKEKPVSEYAKKGLVRINKPSAMPLPYLEAPAKVSIDAERNIFVLDESYAKVYVYNAQGDPFLSVAVKDVLKEENLKPLDMAVSNDKIFVLTKENIKVFDAKSGAYITNIGSKGKGRGQFSDPMAIDILDNLIYILDAGNKRVQILEYGEKQSKTQSVERTLEEKTKIAIFDFKDTNALSKSKQFGETVSEMFITSCVNTQNFIVVERKEIKRVLDELQFNLTDMIDISTAKKVGKMLGVDYGIVGSVAVFEDAIEIDVRFIQLETGVIVLAESKRAVDEVNLRKSVNEIVTKIERIYVNRMGATQTPSGFYTLGNIRSVYLRWDKSVGEDISAYKIYRSSSPDGEFNLVNTVSVNEYNDTGLEEGAEYYYKISAVSSKGSESKLSDVIACKTREKLNFGNALKVNTKIYVKKCKFSWNESEKEGIREYQIFRCDPDSKDYKLVGTAVKTQYEDTGLDDGKTYSYKIKKVFQNGQESQFSEAFSCQTDARPQAPESLSAESHLAQRIIIQWEKSKVDSDIARYHIFRSDSAEGEFKPITKEDQRKYTDKKLLDNTTYFYKLQAEDVNGLLSDLSEPVQAITKNIPSSPANLTAESKLPRKIILKWDKNPEKDITQYEIYRADALDGEYKKIGISKTNEFINYPLPDFTEYFYFLKAIDVDKLESLASAKVSAKTKPLPQLCSSITAVSGQPRKITLTWDKNPEADIKAYNVLASKDNKAKYRKLKEVQETTFVYDKLGDSETFYFKTTATDQDGLTGNEPEAVQATTKPLPLKPENAKAEFKDGKVSVFWETVACEDLFGYCVYKNNAKVDVVKDTLYVDDKVKPGDSLKYEISTVDSDNLESPKSEVVKIKVPEAVKEAEKK